MGFSCLCDSFCSISRIVHFFESMIYVAVIHFVASLVYFHLLNVWLIFTPDLTKTGKKLVSYFLGNNKD